MLPSPGVAVTSVGGPGGPDGVTVTDADSGPSPSAFVAATVTVYSVPFVSPVSTQLVAPDVEQDTSPGDADTVYPLIGEPTIVGRSRPADRRDPVPGRSRHTRRRSRHRRGCGRGHRDRRRGRALTVRVRRDHHDRVLGPVGEPRQHTRRRPEGAAQRPTRRGLCRVAGDRRSPVVRRRRPTDRRDPVPGDRGHIGRRTRQTRRRHRHRRRLRYRRPRRSSPRPSPCTRFRSSDPSDTQLVAPAVEHDTAYRRPRRPCTRSSATHHHQPEQTRTPSRSRSPRSPSHPSAHPGR